MDANDADNDNVNVNVNDNVPDNVNVKANEKENEHDNAPKKSIKKGRALFNTEKRRFSTEFCGKAVENNVESAKFSTIRKTSLSIYFNLGIKIKPPEKTDDFLLLL